MREILAYIETKRKEFSQLPLFDFMKDKSINPWTRLSFAPCMAHFVMGFGDFNRYIFPNYELDTPLQKIINQYAIEDSDHWIWFVKDLERLGFDMNWNFTQTLKLLWGEETRLTRQITYQIIGRTLKATPKLKLVAIEVLEATGNTFFLTSVDVATELQRITHKQYQYFGNTHLDAEEQHSKNASEVQSVLSKIELTESELADAFNMVDELFAVFSEWTYELLSYTQKHNIELNILQELQKQPVHF